MGIDQGDERAKKVHRIVGYRFLSVPFGNERVNFREARVGGAKLGNARVISLDQLLDGRAFPGVGITRLDDGVGRVFFRRIELGKSRTEDAGLPVVRTVGGNVFLSDAIFDGPNLGAIVLGTEADDHQFKKSLIWRKVELVVQASGQ